MKAFLKNHRQSPRKVRLVASLIQGKPVDQALVELDFVLKRASLPMKKLVASALANAKQMGISEDNLFVKEFRVDKGVTLKRMRARAMGRGARINKRTSNVTLVLAEGEAPKNKKKSRKKEVKVEVKDVVVKSTKGATKSKKVDAPKVKLKSKKAKN